MIGALRIAELIGAHRDKDARHQRLEQRDRPRELRLSRVLQRRLVALHASAPAASQQQSV